MRVTQQQPNGEQVVLKECLSSGEYFGEMALLKEAPRMASVTATSDLVCMVIDRTTFTLLLGPMKTILEREVAAREREVERAKQPKIRFDDLAGDTILGVGTFGRVRLVVHTPTTTTYALKCLRKAHVVATKQVCRTCLRGHQPAHSPPHACTCCSRARV